MKLFEGRDLPLALRVAQASFGLTMLTVAALFAVFMLLTLAEIPGNTRKANENAGSVLAEAIVTDVNFVLGDLGALSRSSLVWTSLSDSTGRELYLKPFLETRSHGAAETGVVLADYRGRVVLGKPAEGLTPRMWSAWPPWRSSGVRRKWRWWMPLAVRCCWPLSRCCTPTPRTRSARWSMAST